jgi:hypothetical protein
MKQVLFFLALSLPLRAQVKITQQGNEKVSVEIDGKPFADFYVGPETMKPYLSPLRTASGKVVTRGYPMATDVAGEAHDHPHHRGLWFTHGDVNGWDFWGNEDSQKGAGKGKGKVVLTKIDRLTSGAKAGTIAATFEWKIPSGAALLRETRLMTFYSDPQIRTVDLDITLSPLETVKFGDTNRGNVCHSAGSASRGGAAQGPSRAKAHRQDGERREPGGGEERVGQTLELGGLLGTTGRTDGRDGDLRSPFQPAPSGLLARAGVRAICREHFRRARF